MVGSLTENFLQVVADLLMHWTPERGEGVECWLLEDGQIVFDRWQA